MISCISLRRALKSRLFGSALFSSWEHPYASIERIGRPVHQSGGNKIESDVNEKRKDQFQSQSSKAGDPSASPSSAKSLRNVSRPCLSLSPSECFQACNAYATIMGMDIRKGRRRTLMFLFLGALLALFSLTMLSTRFREIRVQTLPCFLTNHPDGGGTFIIHPIPLPLGRVLYRSHTLGTLVAYVQTDQQIETNAGNGNWFAATNLPSGGFGYGPGPANWLWTPPQETEAEWRMRINYKQILRFKTRSIVTLRRAIIYSPPLVGSGTNKTVQK